MGLLSLTYGKQCKCAAPPDQKEKMMISKDRYFVEGHEGWRDWVEKIPYLKFSADWNVKVIPPFAGAMARFIIKKGKAKVSVYLDVSNALGYGGKHYWEVYPYKDVAFRCDMNETKKLLQAIRTSIDEQLERK